MALSTGGSNRVKLENLQSVVLHAWSPSSEKVEEQAGIQGHHPQLHREFAANLAYVTLFQKKK